MASDPQSHPPGTDLGYTIGSAVLMVIAAAFSYPLWSISEVFRIATICCGVGVPLLMLRLSRGVGLALGLGAAMIAVMPSLTITALSVLFFNFSDDPAGRNSFGSFAGLVLSPVWGLLLFNGFRALTREDCASPEISAAVAAIGVVVVLLATRTTERTGPTPSQLIGADQSVQSLRTTVRDLSACLASLRERGDPYPASLELLRNQCEAARGLPPDSQYLLPEPDASGTTASFSLCARVDSPLPGQTVSAGLDARGAWHQPVPAPSLQPCAAGWKEAGGVLHCILEYRATHRAQGFPVRMRDLGPNGTDCLWRGPVSAEHSYGSYSYFADAAGPDGRINSFRLIRWSDSESVPRLFVDQTGVWRHTTEPRFAGPGDAPWRRTDDAGTNIGTPALSTFETACDSGDMAACRTRGLHGLADRARQAFDQHAFSPPLRPHAPIAPSDVAVSIAFFKRACDGGDARGCHHWGRTEAIAGADAALLRTAYARGCQLGNPRACFELSELDRQGIAGPRDVKLAAQLAEQACHAGDPVACMGFSYALRDGVGVAPDAARARRTMRYACAGLNIPGCATYR